MPCILLVVTAFLVPATMFEGGCSFNTVDTELSFARLTLL